MENGENKDLQGRREFFKEAAKKALPILGTVVMISNPTIAKTINTALVDISEKENRKNDDSDNKAKGTNESDRSGCVWGCYGGCYGCTGTCTGTCNGCYGCIGTCTGTCNGCYGCIGTCTGTCNGCYGCIGTCTGTCYAYSY